METPLTKFAAALALLLAACGTTSGGSMSGAPVSLAGSSWRLTELRSPEDSIGIVHPVDPGKYAMTLNADGAVTMQLDCNRGTGRWTSAPTDARGGMINFSPLAMTRAACLKESLDTRVARELGFVRTYIIDGDKLILNMVVDGGTQVWTRAPG